MPRQPGAAAFSPANSGVFEQCGEPVEQTVQGAKESSLGVIPGLAPRSRGTEPRYAHQRSQKQQHAHPEPWTKQRKQENETKINVEISPAMLST